MAGASGGLDAASEVYINLDHHTPEVDEILKSSILLSLRESSRMITQYPESRSRDCQNWTYKRKSSDLHQSTQKDLPPRPTSGRVCRLEVVIGVYINGEELQWRFYRHWSHIRWQFWHLHSHIQYRTQWEVEVRGLLRLNQKKMIALAYTKVPKRPLPNEAIGWRGSCRLDAAIDSYIKNHVLNAQYHQEASPTAVIIQNVLIDRSASKSRCHQ